MPARLPLSDNLSGKLRKEFFFVFTPNKSFVLEEKERGREKGEDKTHPHKNPNLNVNSPLP